MFPVGFEPMISAGERPHTYALDRAATGTGLLYRLISVNSGISHWSGETLGRDTSNYITGPSWRQFGSRLRGVK